MLIENITTEMMTNMSMLAIGISVVLIIISGIILSIKSKEEVAAKKVLKTLEDIKKGKTPKKAKLEIKPSESSLKDMLSKKFKPKIESQLKTKIKIIDFNAKDENFLALVEISEVRILLTLDSSGKIVDYKKVKKE